MFNNLVFVLLEGGLMINASNTNVNAPKNRVQTNAVPPIEVTSKEVPDKKGVSFLQKHTVSLGDPSSFISNLVKGASDAAEGSSDPDAVHKYMKGRFSSNPEDIIATISQSSPQSPFSASPAPQPKASQK